MLQREVDRLRLQRVFRCLTRADLIPMPDRLRVEGTAGCYFEFPWEEAPEAPGQVYILDYNAVKKARKLLQKGNRTAPVGFDGKQVTIAGEAFEAHVEPPEASSAGDLQSIPLAEGFALSPSRFVRYLKWLAKARDPVQAKPAMCNLHIALAGRACRIIATDGVLAHSMVLPLAEPFDRPRGWYMPWSSADYLQHVCPGAAGEVSAYLDEDDGLRLHADPVRVQCIPQGSGLAKATRSLLDCYRDPAKGAGMVVTLDPKYVRPLLEKAEDYAEDRPTAPVLLETAGNRAVLQYLSQDRTPGYYVRDEAVPLTEEPGGQLQPGFQITFDARRLLGVLQDWPLSSAVFYAHTGDSPVSRPPAHFIGLQSRVLLQALVMPMCDAQLRE